MLQQEATEHAAPRTRSAGISIGVPDLIESCIANITRYGGFMVEAYSEPPGPSKGLLSLATREDLTAKETAISATRKPNRYRARAGIGIGLLDLHCDVPFEQHDASLHDFNSSSLSSQQLFCEFDFFIPNARIR